jgi:hypothetical protein
LFSFEIEQPALGNSTLKRYIDKNLREAVWEEILQKFGGEKLDMEEKRHMVGRWLQRRYVFVGVYICYVAV